MRTLFIAGFGEDEFVFDKIKGALPGEKLILSLWHLLPDYPERDLTVSAFAGELVQRYQITDGDLVIGHSTGGWVAIHIKQLVNCPVIQLASWTDERKVVAPRIHRRLIYLAAQTGLYLNQYILRYLLTSYYHDKPSRDIFRRVFERLISGNRANAVNQLRLIFNPYPTPVTVKPDLRIHAKADRVILFPDELTQVVPGDHFSLYTYPEEVVTLIKQFLG